MSDSPPAPPTDDPFLWLEDVQGERALDWVRERNAVSQKELEARPEYAPIRGQLLDVLNSKDRIPYVTRRGDWLYNLWQDETHKRGLWRRATLAEYRKPQPLWDTIIDLDALARDEGENWVWGGSQCLGPQYRRCLVSLSRGGADAKVTREFDLVDKRFVKNGFVLPEAKSEVDWIDDDTVYVATDFGPGSLTDSGYPRVVKRWKRGTPLADAATVFEGEKTDVAASAWIVRTPGYERTLFVRSIDFYHRQTLLLQGDKLVPLDIPSDATASFMRDTLLLSLRSDFNAGDHTFPAGSLVVADAAAYLRGERKLKALFTPTATRSLAGYTTTRDHVIVDVLDNVASKLEQWTRRGGPTDFAISEIKAPFPGTLSATGLHDELVKDDPLANHYLLNYTDFLTPDSLFLAAAGSDRRELLKQRKPLFDAAGMRVEQRFATSKDGTRVPYFIVWPKGAKADGRNPTLLYGYGGFEISLNPWYSGGLGRAWYQRGGVYVVANIRGGGEYGPAWHRSAIKEHKQRSYDDFIAVAEDLVARKITTPRQLGIEGGSNGGLLVGAVFVQRPELFNAVVCQVPLLDMRRYHLLLAGASWMAEYGNPDVPAEWDFISRYSPYQNVRRDVKYPRVLFTTSTRDDRVHPGHARKMVARMLALGYEPLYYENIEGGHGGAADNEQRAHLQALEFSYLWEQLGSPDASR
ncbi:MAG: prolyl oligopeptidase family serine peptidase [Rhizobacter sp.]